MELDVKLLTWCTTIQKQTLKAVNKEGSIGKAAKKLNLAKSTVQSRVDSIRRQAMEAGYTPQDSLPIVPENHIVKSISTLYDGEGNVKTKRVTTHKEQEHKLILFKEAVSDILEDFKGCSNFVKPPKNIESDLLSVIPMPDLHLGMLSWEKETGNAYDLNIANKQIITTLENLISKTPNSEKILIPFLGDLFHTDNSTNMTLAHGNILDVDSRYPKMIAAGIKLVKLIIERALQKHKEVIVWIRQGNHDQHSSIALALTMQAVFENNPRVKVSVTPGQFDALKHGKCLIACTHGHTVAQAKLPLLMASLYPEYWGNTMFRRWYTGHVHHDEVIEHPGCTVEKLRAICGKDAWSHSMGFISGRDIKCDIWHKNLGMIQRYIEPILVKK